MCVDDSKINALIKDVERLTKRNKILTKRIKKLETENGELVNEIECLDGLNTYGHTKHDVCPFCESSVEKFKIPNDRTLIICNNCTYRDTLTSERAYDKKESTDNR